MLKLRSDQTDSVSVDLHQQRLNGDERLLSFGHTCGRLRGRKIKRYYEGLFVICPLELKREVRPTRFDERSTR